MRIGVFGTGAVGRTIATKLVEIGHEVCMGSRTADNEAGTAWSAAHGDTASQGTFLDAAHVGEVVFNCTNGGGALAAVNSAAEALKDKLLIDVCNPLEFPDGSPSLFVGISDSLGEQIQRALPDTMVVKALNTMNADVMVDPALVPGDHVVFVCGNDEGAKARTVELLTEFGWSRERAVDCGDISGARATEAYLLLWLRMMGAVGGWHFNVALLRAP
jgi:8-hydroxy-5-deazaflavin:NADPH oxidoreductase